MTPYEQISRYCEKNEKSQIIRDIAFAIYQKKVEESISSVPDANTLQIEQTLLTGGNLYSHVKQAEDQLELATNKKVQEVRRKDGWKSFFVSIGSGVTGNIVYSVLLIIAFFLGRDQIASWLHGLDNVQESKPVTEKKGTEN